MKQENVHLDENLLRQFGKDFNDEIRLLFGILGRVQKYNTSPHLGVVSIRLDFNRFLTNNNRSFGNSRDTKILKTFFFSVLIFFLLFDYEIDK
jgi:hypothetical protein